MCGIAGIMELERATRPQLRKELNVMKELIKHRGPDGDGLWINDKAYLGLAHTRLSIIDIEKGGQPFIDEKNCLIFNGEIYNYIELREEIGSSKFRTNSDTEVIMHSYFKWGRDCLSKFRGMFSFALWDENRGELFCARDRFGIKPFYYAIVGSSLLFASEAKALLPFVPSIEIDENGLKDYFAFQFYLSGKTLFKGINELLPGHMLSVRNGKVIIEKYWEVFYDLDWDHTEKYFHERIASLVDDSIRVHLRSDVPVGAYVSGGIDSGIIATRASQITNSPLMGFTGKFSLGEQYDESKYARSIAGNIGMDLREVDIKASDFVSEIRRIIYHLDYPVAGPGSFPQFMVSKVASRHRKVVLGGQGGDEIFGGYTRYLVAYFEQCIKAAIDGTMSNGNFIVTYESIIPNLVSLKNYKPMLQEFWREGLFEERDKRYFKLVNRAPMLKNEIRWDELSDYSPFDTFRGIFNGDNVGNASYFDQMTHFDFKTLLPALLQVEDRVSMAHGLESRVPLLDHALVELVATIPSNVKFKHGTMKQSLKLSSGRCLPPDVLARNDKMGFPVPLGEWFRSDIKDFVIDVFSSKCAQHRRYVDSKRVIDGMGSESAFGRKLWGLLCLELWQQEFCDKQDFYRNLLKN